MSLWLLSHGLLRASPFSNGGGWYFLLDALNFTVSINCISYKSIELGIKVNTVSTKIDSGKTRFPSYYETGAKEIAASNYPRHRRQISLFKIQDKGGKAPATLLWETPIFGKYHFFPAVIPFILPQKTEKTGKSLPPGQIYLGKIWVIIATEDLNFITWHLSVSQTTSVVSHVVIVCLHTFFMGKNSWWLAAFYLFGQTHFANLQIVHF